MNGLIRTRMIGGIAVLLLGVCPAVASAQSVQGHGKFNNAGYSLDDEISVNACLDKWGNAHGYVVWTGDVPKGDRGGPSDPWIIEVTGLFFDGNTVYVQGVIVHSVFPQDIGQVVGLSFTDNSGTGQPDQVNGNFIEAGNIIVDD